MRPFHLLFLFLIFISCQEERIIELAINELPEKTIDAQYKIISILSGNESIGNNEVYLKSRTTNKERKITREYLSHILIELGLSPIEHNYKEPNDNPLIDLLLSPFKGTNLYAVLPSTINLEEFLVIGAHYDTARACPGANDNASAIAVIYGVAKKLSHLANRKKSVIIVFFDQEEENLVGSRAFAKFINKENYTLHSVHTLDQLGWDKDLDRAIELELPTAQIEKIYRDQANKLNIPIFTTKVNSTDHQSFRELGFDAVGITEEYVHGDTTPYKDTKDDTIDTIDLDYIESTTTLIFNVVEELINQD